MKKYIKPEFNVVCFDVNSEVMTAPTATPSPTSAVMAKSSALVLSTPYTNYIPSTVEKKVWSSVDSFDWNWEE